MSPDIVNRLSVFEYLAAVDGWIAANVPEDKARLNDDEADDLWNLIETL